MKIDDESGPTPLSTDSLIYDRLKAHPDAVRSIEEGAKAEALMSPEAARKHMADNWAPVFRRYDLLSTEAAALAGLDRIAHGKVPDEATRAGWRDAAKAALLAEYGPDRVGQALADARAFIGQDPQLKKFAMRGFGDHKVLGLMAARLGGQARKEGRLK